MLIKYVVFKKGGATMDARVRYTKMVIRNCFFQLLNEKKLNKITVKEICEKASINRATFYKYYDNPFDLYKQLEQELMDQLEERIISQQPENFLIVFQIILQDIKDNSEFYQLLFSENGDELFRNRVFALCYGENMKTIKTIMPDASPKEQEWLYYFIAEGCNGILIQWINGGMKEPVEDIVKFTKRLVAGINNHLGKLPNLS